MDYVVAIKSTTGGHPADAVPVNPPVTAAAVFLTPGPKDQPPSI